MVEWLAYGFVVSALLSVAAWVAERGALAQRWPTRWVWAGALAGSVALPLATWLLPRAVESAPIAALPGAYVLGSLPALTVGAAEPAGPSLGTILVAGWVVISLVLMVAVAVTAVRLTFRARRWRPAVVEGVEVLVSRRTGPAALGLVRGRVVLPEWALSLDATHRRLLVLHEAEHVRARDPQLALAGLVVCIAAPWNLPLWWQLQRLRLALEVDCDARVIARAGDRRGYGSLLLEVGQRRTRLALALAEPRRMLERRIRMITTTTRKATVRAFALAAVSAMLLGVACETPAPTGVADAEPEALERAETMDALASFGCDPGLYLNGAETTRAEVGSIPPERLESVSIFRAKGASEGSEGVGACGAIFLLTKDATAEEQQRARSLIEREAARTARTDAEPEAPRQAASLDAIRSAPTFTPMTQRPELQNASDVRAALVEHYPPLLRDAGIGGAPSVWFLIGEDGRLVRSLINQSSGHDALDQAALRVAEVMRFTPARLDDSPVPVWVSFNVTFQPSMEAPQEPAPPTARPGAQALAAPEPAVGSRPAREGFTPMTERPELLNSHEVQELLQSHYPPLLKEAGVGGTAAVWLYIDQTGAVQDLRVNESSGRQAFDRAALVIGEQTRWKPARNGDEPVAVWVSLDIAFEAQ